MAQHSKRFARLRDKIKTTGPVALPDAVRHLEELQHHQVQPDGRGLDPPGDRPQADRSERPRLGGACRTGSARAVRVAVFAQGDNAEKARAAGADIVGGDDLAQQIKGGTMDFDVALATPDMMGVVGPLGRVLGPRGLMPSPRSGTVTTDITAAVREFKAGKIEFRNDKGGNVAVPVGKLALHRGAARRQHQRVPELPAVAQAGHRQGNLHPLDHRLGHHEPGHPGHGLSRARDGPPSPERSSIANEPAILHHGINRTRGDRTEAMSKYVKEMMMDQLKIGPRRQPVAADPRPQGPGRHRRARSPPRPAQEVDPAQGAEELAGPACLLRHGDGGSLEVPRGPVGRGLGGRGVPELAKEISTQVKTLKKPEIKGGPSTGGRRPRAGRDITKLPSREVLIGQVLGLLLGPAQQTLSLLTSPAVDRGRPARSSGQEQTGGRAGERRGRSPAVREATARAERPHPEVIDNSCDMSR